MTLVLNGTTGVSSVDGSAATPAIQGNDTNTGVFFPAADTVAIATGGSERVRADSSGNVGIGVTPSAWVSNFKALQVGTGGTFYGDYNNTTSYFGNNAFFNGSAWKYVSSSYALYAYQDRSAGKHVWAVASSGTAGNNITWTEAMTLDSSGYLLINQTSNVTSSYLQIKGAQPAISCESTSTGSVSQVLFRNPNGQVGSIGTSGTSTSYNTSSDYRLKEQVQPMTGALAKVALLRPVTYKWKVDGSDGEGFVAHELAEVVPDAVTGEKDAVNEDGSIKPQGIDTSFLVATLTAAIQELKAELDTAKARIAALEAA